MGVGEGILDIVRYDSYREYLGNNLIDIDILVNSHHSSVKLITVFTYSHLGGTLT